MNRFSAIDLSRLSAPKAIEQIDYEVILAEMKSAFLSAYEELRVRNPDLPAIDTLHLETEPLNIAFQTMAYREVLVRQVGNDKYMAATLAYATGTDLEAKAAELGVERRVIDIGDPNANPPVPPTYETDIDLRFRAQLAWEALSTAGPTGAYLFHALTSNKDVLDAAIFGPHSDVLGAATPDPGQVLVVILSREEGGTASTELIDAVSAYLSDETRRPLTDEVIVESATVTDYTVEATITVGPGASAEEVRLAAVAAVEAYAADQYVIGTPIRLNRLAAALYVADDTGRSPVANVAITSPAADIVPDPRAAPRCTGVTVTVEVA